MKGKKLSMTIQILIAMVVGIALGLIFGEAIAPIKLVGDIFLRLIQMSVVFLIMGAVIESVGNLDIADLGRIGGKMFFLFMATTAMAAVFGIFFGEIIKPGEGLTLTAAEAVAPGESLSLYELILDFFPENVLEAMTTPNMIQVIVFAIFFGVALSIYRSQQKSCAFQNVIHDFNGIILGMVSMVMVLAPLGIGALLAYTTGTIGFQVILPLAKFLLVFGLGTAIHLSLIIFAASFYCKVSPFRVGRKLVNMTVVAFTTTSSAVSLPIKMADSENKLGVSKKISGLVNPLGMTLNSNGLAMFLSLSCVTIAQIYGIELSLSLLVKVVVMSTLSCLGTVVVPGGGLVALTIVVPGLGLPLESIALLSGIDWFSGMFRTVLNVDIDALVAMVIAKGEGELDYAILGTADKSPLPKASGNGVDGAV